MILCKKFYAKNFTQKIYIKNLDEMKNTENHLRFNLLITEYNKIYLRSDIAESEGILRIEMMYFEMDTSLDIWRANSDCRGRYSRGIYFIEYDSEKEAEENIVKAFMSIQDDGEEIYLLCNENELEDILKNYPNKAIYVMSTKDFTKK